MPFPIYEQAYQWTINLKSFEIDDYGSYKDSFYEWTINLKSFEILFETDTMPEIDKWTINLKSFEIEKNHLEIKCMRMNYKLEKFWNKKG